MVVAGGGLAGAAAAAALARTGVDVTLIEREAKPVDKICGEFLSIEAQAYLTELGLDVAALGGEPISRLRLVRGGNAVSTALPFHGLGLSRFRLDEALLDHAAACGATVMRGHAVRSITVAAETVLDVEGIGIVQPQTVLLATGKHELRGAKRDSARGLSEAGDLIGFKMYFRLEAAAQAALGGVIELIFFSQGYAGLQMVEGGLANLCLLVERERYQRAGGTWAGLLEDLCRASPYLARQLAGAEAMLAQPLSIYRVPYGFVYQPGAADPARLFRVGDQACVIQSFTGDGMSIALHSAALAVAVVLRGDDGPAYHRQLSSDISRQIQRADILYKLMNRSTVQAGLFGLARLWPASLSIAARLTRVPARARLV